ncbi:hypothetical protein [Nocardia sp. CC227C]|uniref:hypothetical protein n=1 Tax=Nocardia sp. CC227C TaxID=3044562 RepID=UPI00278C8A0E|nr:hypothetical protein [Nocardia sp. CC227C]
MAVVENAGLAADDDDLKTIKRQSQEALEAVEALRSDGSTYRVLESAAAGGGRPTDIQQWLLIDVVTLGPDGPPDVRFTLDRPDLREQLDLADLRDAIVEARAWADQREADLHAREQRQRPQDDNSI